MKARELYGEYTAAREAMLKATHTDNAPWTLVDFNSQKRGRLTLIGDLLGRLPDCKIPREEIEFPPLGHEPLDEEFTVLKPIPGFED